MDVSRSELELINRSALESSSSLRWPVEKHLNPPVKDRRDAAPGKSTPSVRAMWKVGHPPGEIAARGTSRRARSDVVEGKEDPDWLSTFRRTVIQTLLVCGGCDRART